MAVSAIDANESDHATGQVDRRTREGGNATLTAKRNLPCRKINSFPSLYHEHAGRHRSGTSNTSSAPAKHAKPKAGTAGGCIHHPHSTTHTTAECRAAASSSSTSTEGKHA